MFLGSVLTFAAFFEYDSDVTSVALAIEQFTSESGNSSNGKKCVLQSTDKHVLTFFFRIYFY